MIILLGGSGFLGNHLIKELQKTNYNFKTMFHKNELPENIETFSGSVNTPDSLFENISEGDIVINLTGQIIQNDSNFLNKSVNQTLNILNACKKNKVKKIIFASSINVYGDQSGKSFDENDSLNPTTQYGLTKMKIEQTCENFSKQFDLPITILRFSLIYGTGQVSGFFGNIQKSFKTSEPITIYHNGEQSRDVIFVDDAIKAIISSLSATDKKFTIYNISSGNSYKINEIIALIEKTTNKKLNVILSKMEPDEKYLCADNSKAKKFLKFQINTDLEHGITQIFNH